MYAITPRHHRVWRRHLPRHLGARRAAYFDRQGIAREYEPARLDGWSPDFRSSWSILQKYSCPANKKN